MTDGRQKLRHRGLARAAGGGSDEEPAPRSFGHCLRGAFAAIAGDARQLRAFRAAPATFLSRHHIDVSDPVGASALQALAQLAGVGRPADPSGEAKASDGLVIAPSPIHGEGVYAESDLGAGTAVCDVMVGPQVSHTASKINKSGTPNVEMVLTDGGLQTKTTRVIDPGEELVGDYPLLSQVPSGTPPPRSS
jgi:hypothetical protein